MNQPDLGLKVSELRQQRGLTQEQLAESCEVSLRTIQRIESGEVDPRAYTLQCLSAALEFDFSIEGAANENLWLALLHLSSMFCIVIIPLLLWSWKKKESVKIDKQGRQVLNFQITMTLVLFAVLFVLMIVPVALAFMGEAGINTVEGGPTFMLLVMCSTMPLLLIGIFCMYQGVVNAMRALSDKPVHYALSIPIVK
ncbi:MAG: helix-turn-helix domain-containing protein [Chloroflexota bacterium]